MISNRMTRAELIRWLGDTIRTETAKPFDEIDYDLVDECGNLLDELMGTSAVLSEEEIAVRAANVLPESVAAVRTQPKIKLRRFWKIAVAAAVVLCMAVTVMAVPALRTMLISVLQLNLGESVEDGGITYINAGTQQRFATIEEVLENEDLSFVPPHIQSETLTLEKITLIDEVNTVYLSFSDPSISYEIWLDNTDITPYTSNSTEYTLNEYTTYVVIQESSETKKYFAYTLIDNDIHVIKSPSLETIELLISNINGQGD